MKSGRTIPVLFAASLLAAAPLSAADNPYRVISEKNAFRLVPPPPPPPPVSTVPKEPPTNVKFMGTSGVGKEITAWFAIDKKDPKNPAPIYVSLAPGQRESAAGMGGLELVELNDAEGSAKIRYNDEQRIVSIEKAPKTGGPAGPGPIPGQPMIPTFGGAPFNPVPSAPAASALANPVGGQVNSSALAVPPPSLPVNTLQGIPTRTMRSGALANPTPEPTARPLTYEESVVNMEVLREMTKKQVNAGQLPPLPPTPLTPSQAVPPVPGGN